jgi:hypothetical protein
VTYQIARAAGRQWTESAAVPGLRHATLINAPSGASHLEVRLVDRLLGAQHHTLFVAQIAPRAGHGQAADEHYHPVRGDLLPPGRWRVP